MATEHQGLHLSRRRFIQRGGVAGLGLLAGCGRLPGQAQPPRVGALVGARPLASPEGDALRQGLQDLGYIDGQNVMLDWRSAEGNVGRLAELAVELVRVPTDVIVTAGPPATRAAQQATSRVPIVMATVGSADPVAEGFVASLAHPGGNITGLSELSPQLYPKRLQLLKDAVPEASSVGLLINPDGRTTPVEEMEAAARMLDLRVHWLEVNGPDEIERAFQAASQSGVSAIMVLNSALLLAQGDQIAELAMRTRLPAMADQRPYVDAGALMTYAVSLTDMFRRAAAYVDKILKGAKPADLPVEQPMLLDFIINLRTAQALGLTIPPHVLLQATEVIQ